MADYKATTAEFQSVANAIRTKGGTSGQLVWPTGFVSAVQAIPTGGGSAEFEGDGREYFFDWVFSGASGYVHVTKDGVVTIGNNDTDEINGDYIYKASNSPVVTAKTNCYAKVGSASSLGAEASFANNDSISASISGYERLIIAYDQSGKTSQFEVGIGWVFTAYSSAISTERCIIKADGTFLPHSGSSVVGACVALPVSASVSDGICACNAIFVGELFYFESNGKDLSYKRNYELPSTTKISYPPQTSSTGKSYIVFALADS